MPFEMQLLRPMKPWQWHRSWLLQLDTSLGRERKALALEQFSNLEQFAAISPKTFYLAANSRGVKIYLGF